MDKKQNLLANMHSFSVAARYLSFTQAAKELNLTQGAVSHRIKNLEKQLGFKLFIRLTRKMELTPEGERLLVTLNQSIDNIYSELEDIRCNELSGELYIGTSPGFASGWLVPRLASFQALYPNLNIRLLVRENQIDFQYEPIDLAIYYSDGCYPDCYSQRLFDVQRIPVCTPEYAERYDLLGKGIAALSKVNFIHGGANSTIWKRWLKEMGADIDCSQRCYVFNQSELDIMAARRSIGIAMGRRSFVSQYLASGELIAPFPEVDIDSGMGYDLVCPEGLQHRPKFQAFAAWVKEELELTELDSKHMT